MTQMFDLKDSGERLKFDSGMVRDVETGKTKWHLVASGPMLERWAVHLTKGSFKYSDNNWMQASGEVELERFRRSAFRHFMQWYRGDTDEDHAAALYFNINGACYVLDKMQNEQNGVEYVKAKGNLSDRQLEKSSNPHPRELFEKVGV